MCSVLNSAHVLPGWGCCRCRVYNGPQRPSCRVCDAPPCSTIDRVQLAQDVNERVGSVRYNIYSLIATQHTVIKLAYPPGEH